MMGMSSWSWTWVSSNDGNVENGKDGQVYLVAGVEKRAAYLMQDYWLQSYLELTMDYSKRLEVVDVKL